MGARMLKGRAPPVGACFTLLTSPVAITFLATDRTLKCSSMISSMGSRTVSSIVTDTCEAIWRVLKPLELQPPSSKERWEEIAKNFHSKTNFLNCLGAVDGKHVLLLAVVDADYRFIAIDVGAYGRESDSNIFNDWTFGKNLARNELNLPSPKALPNTDNPSLPYVFLGTKLALNTNILRPYPRNNLNEQRRVFNHRLSRARRLVECTFGILFKQVEDFSYQYGLFHQILQYW
ncbi:hypothetical protein NQ317_000445 [Molorchus minor]|uniref:DDE Tnp4 domain-containing protein n=1 Tax=Molorchus minor TaxID=1323400 RepID=A0ABQ9J715_9CUCU|nr:hypothetical protein NQ317_000445 [Molorchus minor]